MINTVVPHRTENRMPDPEPNDEVATTRRAAVVSWIAVAISLLTLLLANGPLP